MQKTPMRKAREKAGLTLEQVAAGTGIPFSTIQALESGRGAGYSFTRKCKIAEFLKVPWPKLWPEEWAKAKVFSKLYDQTIRAETELLHAHKELARLKDAKDKLFKRATAQEGPQ